MSVAFSSPENVCLEREIQLCNTKLELNEVWNECKQKESSAWINENKFLKVALQFPDDYLRHSTKIYKDLETECSTAKFFILADTSYGSCCVDEVAAAHVEADAVIHFGNACMSQSSRLPVFYVFPNFAFDCDNFARGFEEVDDLKENRVVVYLDIGYQYVVDDLQRSLTSFPKVELRKFPSKDGDLSTTLKDTTCVFVGQDNQNFFTLSIQTDANQWYLYDPKLATFSASNPKTTNWIRRRYFCIEKLKDAQTVGLIVASLTGDGHLDVVKHIQQMARQRGVRTHMISVGRINPAKLANFMEIDCFVLIGCPFNNMFESKEYYKPIVSVFEAELAYNPSWSSVLPEVYAANFKDILPQGKLHREFDASQLKENDVSLITGRMRCMETDTALGETNGNGEVAVRSNHQLMERNRGRVFEERSWQGLEQQLGRTEPAKIEKGRSGIPINYAELQ